MGHLKAIYFRRLNENRALLWGYLQAECVIFFANTPPTAALVIMQTVKVRLDTFFSRSLRFLHVQCLAHGQLAVD